MKLEDFRNYVYEAASFPDIVELSISTRPDCIQKEYLDILKCVSEEYQIAISIELGLQTVNYHTLDTIDRGHSLAEYIDAVLMIQPYSFQICTHIILNLPNDSMLDAIENAKILSALKIDIVKIHSLYIAKNTKLSYEYENGTIKICSKEEYVERLIAFLEHLSSEIVVERLFSRVPEKDSIFSNWNTSWWKLQDEVIAKMIEQKSYQGKYFNYLNGSAMKKLS